MRRRAISNIKLTPARWEGSVATATSHYPQVESSGNQPGGLPDRALARYTPAGVVERFRVGSPSPSLHHPCRGGGVFPVFRGYRSLRPRKMGLTAHHAAALAQPPATVQQPSGLAATGLAQNHHLVGGRDRLEARQPSPWGWEVSTFPPIYRENRAQRASSFVTCPVGRRLRRLRVRAGGGGSRVSR